VAITARVRESNAMEAAYAAVADGASDGELDVEAATPAPVLALEHNDGGYADGAYNAYGDYGTYSATPPPEVSSPAPALAMAEARTESIARKTGFQELSLLPPPTEEPEEEDADPAENYGGTPVDATQLSALVGAPRLGM
jgi:hypothetical protein